jgi:hypothetical protein
LCISLVINALLHRCNNIAKSI